MKLVALMHDGFREAKDRKISTVMFVLSGVFAILCGGFGYEPKPAVEVVEDALRPRFQRHFGAVEEGTWQLEPAGERAVIARWSEEKTRAEKVVDAQLNLRLSRGITSERRERAGTGPELLVRVGDPIDTAGGVRVYFILRRWSFDIGDGEIPVSAKDFVAGAQLLLANAIAGWIGVIIAIIITSGFVPSMIQAGSIHVLLSKPVRRPLLLLGKYLGGVAFVLLHASIFVGLCWIAFSVRTGWWDFRFLILAPTIAATFAIVYAASVLFAVVFESPMVSTLLAIAFWGFCWLMSVVKEMVGTVKWLPEAAREAIVAIYWALPKTGELDDFAVKVIQGSGLTLDQSVEAALKGREWGLMLGSTAASTAAILAIACLIFWRKDY